MHPLTEATVFVRLHRSPRSGFPEQSSRLDFRVQELASVRSVRHFVKRNYIFREIYRTTAWSCDSQLLSWLQRFRRGETTTFLETHCFASLELHTFVLPASAASLELQTFVLPASAATLEEQT